MDLPGYDAWKLASPPEYEQPCACGSDDCEECERIRQAEAVFERWVDQEIDEARERRGAP